MIREKIFCHLSGATFSPKKLIEKAGLSLQDCLEKGEIDAYWKEPIEYGFANLVAPEELLEQKMTWIAQTLAEYETLLRECGVEDIEIEVLIDHEGILNWWLDYENMKIFAALRANIIFTAYYQEEISENSEPELSEIKD